MVESLTKGATMISMEILSKLPLSSFFFGKARCRDCNQQFVLESFFNVEGEYRCSACANRMVERERREREREERQKEREDERQRMIGVVSSWQTLCDRLENECEDSRRKWEQLEEKRNLDRERHSHECEKLRERCWHEKQKTEEMSQRYCHEKQKTEEMSQRYCHEKEKTEKISQECDRLLQIERRQSEELNCYHKAFFRTRFLLLFLFLVVLILSFLLYRAYQPQLL